MSGSIGIRYTGLSGDVPQLGCLPPPGQEASIWQ